MFFYLQSNVFIIYAFTFTTGRPSVGLFPTHATIHWRCQLWHCCTRVHFYARQHYAVQRVYATAISSVCPSIRHTRALYQKGCTYHRHSFTI